jgi:hypothetical protein
MNKDVKCSIKVSQVKWINMDSGNINPLAYEKCHDSAGSVVDIVTTDRFSIKPAKKENNQSCKNPYRCFRIE